jgi:predicted DNA-binding protein (UPF0251 family)
MFKPQGIPTAALERVAISLDGLEAIRLADLEGLYQEAAAERMGISRATFARVLTAARAAVARALVEGKALDIGGGTVARHGARSGPCPIHGSPRRQGRDCRCPGGRRRLAAHHGAGRAAAHPTSNHAPDSTDHRPAQKNNRSKP